MSVEARQSQGREVPRWGSWMAQEPDLVWRCTRPRGGRKSSDAPSLGRLQDNSTVSWGPQEAQRLRVGATDPEVRGWGQWRGGRHSPHLAKRKTDQCVGRGGGVGGVEYIKNIMLVSEHACSCGEDRKDSVVNGLKSSSFKPGGHSYLVQRKPRVCCPVEYKSPLASRTPVLCILS